MRLDDNISVLAGIGPSYARKLQKLEIKSIRDLLWHIPHRYLDFRSISKTKDVKINDFATIRGKVTSIKNLYTRRGVSMQLAEIQDSAGLINAIWFNQPYLTRSIKEGQVISVAGRISWYKRQKCLFSPEYETLTSGLHTGRLVPIYPETSGLSSKWLRSKISEALSATQDQIKEYLPHPLLVKLDLINLGDAVKNIHFPQNTDQVTSAHKRLAFDELLYYQLNSLAKKIEWEKVNASVKLLSPEKAINDFVKTLPFNLTKSQKTALSEIAHDLAKDTPMNRLLEGDVGSGKTVLAAAACFAAYKNNGKSVVMAPTQILANQHFHTFKTLFGKTKAKIELVTSSFRSKEAADIYIGTHALLHQNLDLSNTALIVIDEQHRFGVEQRNYLVNKTQRGKYIPHVLTMTATPIPRTIAKTIYGDLDLSVLNELPAGRQPITTWVVPLTKHDSGLAWIKNKVISENLQAFVVCPLIEESQVESMKQIKAATGVYKELTSKLHGVKLGLLHGKQKSKEKEKIVSDFKDGQIQILVTTPVVEVGIDIPNAAIMLIEEADRFGLAQLHQLRGRVGRGEKKSYCLLFTNSRSRSVQTRLSAMKKNLGGFELSEIDLSLRGPGEVFGTKQHGFFELKIASWQDSELIKLSRDVAQDLIKKPSDMWPKVLYNS